MSTKSPQVLARKANGVSPASAGQSNEPTKRNGNDKGGNASRSNKGRGPSSKHSDTAKTPNEGETSRPARSRPQNEGEKLVIRRLPPGMTQSEFSTILGSDWEAGKGKVDWLSFAAGKVSNDLSKPSRPGRAYIHLMRKDDIMPLSEVVRTSTWEDAKGTFTSPSLIAPPALELCIYKKVPSNKKRSDARQGTIDQDPEFMAFLEELANPTPAKENIKPEDGDDVLKSEAKITTTPLVEYLKEKKANKHKDGASGKNAKGKGKGAARDDEGSKKKGKDGKAEKSNKETVKILTKKEATEQAAEAAKVAAAQIGAANATDNPKNRRAGIAAAARILQRDLGLSPGSAHRRARQEHAKGGTEAKATSGKDAVAATTERPESPAPSESASQTSKGQAPTTTAPKSQTSSRRGRGGKNADKGKAAEGSASQPSAAAANPPMILKKKAEGEGSAATSDSAAPQQSSAAGKSAPASSAAQKAASGKASSQKKPSITPNATRSFVKHANTSQGVTEAALRQALETFGPVTSVDIDKRKGFAYVDFAEPESLVKAVNASPITVAQGAVQVLERKDKKPAANAAASSAAGSAASEKGSGSGSGRGRRGRGGGKGAAATGAPAPAASTSTGAPG